MGKKIIKAIPALRKLTMLLDVNKNHIKNRYTHLYQKAFPCHSLQGSMTVEASIVIPMVLFVWMACISWISLVYVHENIQEVLTESARELAITADKNTELVKDLGVSQTWLKLLTLKRLETGLIESIDHLDMSDSYVLEHNDEIILNVTYRVRLIRGLIPIPSFRLSNRVCVRAWTGGNLVESEIFEDVMKESVFVAEHGYVYHKDFRCSHIHLTIFLVNEDKAKKYVPCEKCKVNESDEGLTYYITATGECYHSRLGCSGLKRQIDSMLMTEAQTMGYRPCSRCGGD